MPAMAVFIERHEAVERLVTRREEELQRYFEQILQSLRHPKTAADYQRPTLRNRLPGGVLYTTKAGLDLLRLIENQHREMLTNDGTTNPLYMIFVETAALIIYEKERNSPDVGGSYLEVLEQSLIEFVKKVCKDNLRDLRNWPSLTARWTMQVHPEKIERTSRYAEAAAAQTVVKKAFLPRETQ